MRKLLFAMFATALFASCSKQMDVKPAEQAPQQVLLKNSNISLKNIAATQTGSNQVTVTFTTEYEKNLKSIELMAGPNENLFCRIYVDYKNNNSLAPVNYSMVDNDPKSSTMYYMIKYTTNDGNWYVSNVVKVVLQK